MADEERVKLVHALLEPYYPAFDAVLVVRCKDCKHYKEFRTKKYKQLMRMCYRWGKYDGEFHVKEDDFCSYGERRNK